MFRRQGHWVLVCALLTVMPFTSSHSATLREAVMAGDLAELERLLEEGVNPNEVEAGLLLYFAAQRGHEEIVTLLVGRGADVNAVTRFGTPLQIAARGNRVDIVETLLKNGADPNIGGGEFLKMPLHEAAERGAMEAATLLLQHGADVNARSAKGHPPIHSAARKGRNEMVMLMRKNGASPMPVEPVMPADIAAADLEQGRIHALACQRCHEMGADRPQEGVTHALGPSLWNVVGRKIASMPDFPYSESLAVREGAWTYEELNRFLADPTGYVPGTNMEFSLEPDARIRIPLIAYLRTLSDSPISLE